MAVTRIKNNQITDSTITAQKIADGTLVGSLFSPDVTFNSNITITGNLAITGNSSSISATNTYVNDPLIVFNHGFTGSPSYDIGTIYNRNLSSLTPYGSVNAAWIWQESEQAFAGIMTTETGNTLGSINNSGFANLHIGNVTAVSVNVTGGIALTGEITANSIVNTPISGSTGYFTTLYGVNFSTANAQISGGAITDTPISGSTGYFTTLYGDNFSSSNVRISGGYISILTNANIITTNTTTLNAGTGTITTLDSTSGNVTTLSATNFSTGNAQITGGSITGLLDATATTLQATNFSTGNAQITGGAITATPISGSTGHFTTLQGTNFSSGNVRISGGYITNLSNITATIANFGTTTSAQLNSTTGNITTLYADNFSTANAVVTGGYVNNLANLSATDANFSTLTATQVNTSAANVSGPLFATSIYTGNAVIVGGYINNLSNISATNGTITNLSATTSVVTNLSSGNIVSTGSTSGTWSTANVSLYSAVLPSTENQNNYIQFSDKSSGNVQLYTDTDLTYNPNTGVLTVPAIVTTGAQNFDTLYVQNFSTANAVISSGYISSLSNINATVANFDTTTSAILNATTGNITTGYLQNLSSGNVRISGGYINNLANLTATYTTVTNFSTGNAQITGGSATDLLNLSATTAYATNLSSGNIVSTGSTSGTWGTANVGLYDNVQSTTTDQLFYPEFVDKTNGNAAVYVNPDFNFNANTGYLTAIRFIGDGYFDTLQGNDFSSGNVRISGGYISGLANISASLATLNTVQSQDTTTTTLNSTNGNVTTLVATNFSTSNAQITGGSLTGLTNVAVTTLVADNFSSGNIRVSGGYLTGLSNVSAIYGTFTNLNASNILATSGSVTGLTTLSATTSQADNFSTGNAIITGGYADNYPIGANTAAPGKFTTLQSSGITTITNSTNSTEIDDGALVIAGGLGIGKDVHIGGNLYVSNVFAKIESTLTIQDPLVYLTANATYPYTYDIGFYSQFVGGPANVYAHTGVIRSHVDGYWGFFSNVVEELNGVNHWNEAGLIWDRIKAGDLILANTTPSTTTTSGALTVAGGAGISGNLNVGGTINAASATFSSINNTPVGNTTPSTGSFTYLNATTGFSTSNAQVTGGSAQGLTVLQAENFSSANILVSGGSATGLTTLSATTAQADNFSSGNAQITGGSATGLVNLTATTGQITNLSSSNINVTGGTVTGLTGLSSTTAEFNATTTGTVNSTNGNITTLSTANFSSSNVRISGGYLTGLANVYTGTAQATNFSSGNVLITGGSVTDLTTASATTLVATNFSTGNAQITGGSILAPTISGTVATANVSLYQDVELQSGSGTYYPAFYDKLSGNAAAYTNDLFSFNPATGVLSVPSISTTSGTGGSQSFNVLQANNFSSGNVVIIGGYLNSLANVYASLAQFTNLSTGNILVTGGTVTGLTNLTATTAQATNFSSGNIVSTGSTSGTWSTANVSLYENIQSSTENSIFYPQFVDKTSGNAASYVNSSLNFNPSTGYLSSTRFVGDGYFTTLQATNLSSGNIRVTGGYIESLTNATITTTNTTTLNAGVGTITTLNSTAGNVTTLVAGNFSSGNVQITGGKLLTMSNVESAGGIIDNLSATTFFSNVVNSIDLNVYGNASIANASVSSLTVTNVNFSGTSTGTVTTANVALYNNVQTNNTNSVFYPTFVDTVSGNVKNYADGDFFYNPSTGILTASEFSGSGVLSNLTVSGNTTMSGLVEIDSNINSTSTTTGALVIYGTGGLGVSGDINVGGTVTAGNLQAPVVGINSTQLSGVLQTNNQPNITSLGALSGLTVSGNIVASSTTNSATPSTGSIVSLGGVGVAGNITSNSGAVFNYSSQAGQDFIVKGVNDSTLLWARPGTSDYDSVVIGGNATTASLTTGAKFIVNATDSMILPKGTTVQRPGNTGGTDVAGMFRFNSTTGTIEWYNGAAWNSAETTFTIVVSQQFNGDGTATVFSLSQIATTASAIVSINGIVQIPTAAYAIIGTTLTFTQAPASGDVIDVRLLTTSQALSSVISPNGSMGFGADDTAAFVLTGTESPVATTYWEPTGGKVSALANVEIASANVATTIDSFSTDKYRTAKYIIQVSNGSDFQSQESLVLSNGSTAIITTYGVVNTGSNLGVVSATVSSGNVLVQFTSVNAGANVRISKDYITI
jgi:trimeric autotransporter adhesin